MKTVIIDDNLIIEPDKTAIIAEVGINHNGNASLAKKMIDSAWEGGADIIKLQSFVTEKFFVPTLPYFKSTKKLELSFKEQGDLFTFAKERGIRLFTTPFDLDTLNFLDDFDLPAYKVASMDCDNYPLIEAIAKKQKPVILSTGMAIPGEIERAVNVIKNTGNNQIILMHCVSDYPARFQDMNLSYMQTLQKKFDIPCGVSDHTIGLSASYLSVGLGANVIEKHFTLDDKMRGQFLETDHTISMTALELTLLSNFCKDVEVLRGNGARCLTENEKTGKVKFRRGLYASKLITKGEVLTSEKLIALRPVNGIPVSMMDKVLGKRVLKTFNEGEPISYEGLET